MTEQERKTIQRLPLWVVALGILAPIAVALGTVIWSAISMSASVGRAAEIQIEQGRRIAAVESSDQHFDDAIARNAAAIAGLTSALTIIENQVDGIHTPSIGGR